MTIPKSTPAWGAPQVEHWTAIRHDLARALRGLPPDEMCSEENRAALERDILKLIFAFVLDWGRDIKHAIKYNSTPPRKPRPVIRKAVRRAVRQRDGNRCGYCGGLGTREHGPDGRVWHIDHRQAFSRGGTNDLTNLVLACKTCNLRKHTRSAEEFLPMIAAGRGHADASRLHDLQPSAARGG